MFNTPKVHKIENGLAISKSHPYEIFYKPSSLSASMQKQNIRNISMTSEMTKTETDFQAIIDSPQYMAQAGSGQIERFDEIEVSYSMWVDCGQEARALEWTDVPSQADIFTVNFHLKAGHTEEVHDFDTLSEANEFAIFLSRHTGLPFLGGHENEEKSSPSI